MRSPTSRIAGVDATGCSAADGVAVDGVAAAARASVTAAAAGVPSTDARFFARRCSAPAMAAVGVAVGARRALRARRDDAGALLGAQPHQALVGHVTCHRCKLCGGDTPS